MKSLIMMALGVLPATACVDGDPASSRSDGEDVDCAAVFPHDVDGPIGLASLEILDLYRGADVDTPVEVRLDGCAVGDDPLGRGYWGLGAGFQPGTRTLSVAVAGVELPAVTLLAQEGDVFLYALDAATPPQLHGAKRTRHWLDSAWSVHLLNMTGAAMDVYRVVDPGAAERDYVLVAHGAPHEMVDAELTPSAEHGAWLRIERAGEAIFEGNVGELAMPCEAGEWPAGGVELFWVAGGDSGVFGGASYLADPTTCAQE
jgi:hypothetical protein